VPGLIADDSHERLAIGFFGAVDASVGQGYELLVISSVIIGGTSLSGGSGTVLGALVGVLVIAVISSGIVPFSARRFRFKQLL
jgi:ribose transport system permease protein